MVVLDYKINGNPASTPKNAEEIKLISNWSDNTDEDNSEAEVSTNSIQFVLEDATAINNHVQGGLNGTTPGIFEGIPYKIDMRDLTDNTVQTILDGYIDLAEESTFISCDEVESRIKKRDNLDWLTTAADGFSFAYLASLPTGVKGKINESDYESIPYVLNFRPDAIAVATLSTSILILSKELAEAIFRTVEAYADFTESIFPPDPSDFLAATLKAAAYAAYAGLIIIALTELVNELINQIFPPVRRYKGMRVRTMFIRGCNFLGLSFKSTIFDDEKWKQLTLIPTKEKAGNLGLIPFLNKDETGHPNQQSAVYNFGDFLREMKRMFNAQIKIVGKTLVFERRDYWERKASYTLPDVETDQNSTGRISSFKYNTNEALANTLISFSTDPADQNTLENFIGTNIQIVSLPNTTNNPDFINLGGLGEVRLPFALATRKDSKTVTEELMEEVADVADGIITAINLIVTAVTAGFVRNAFPTQNFSAKLKGRIGMMALSDNLIGVDKLVILDKSNNIPLIPIISDFNAAAGAAYASTSNGILTKLSASDLWHGFHFVNSFTEIYDLLNGGKVHNQYKLYEGVEMPFCKDDWNALQLNNRFNTVDGRVGEVLRIEWDLHNDKAVLDYKVKEVYTKNIKLVLNAGR
jgi:hypothetical protein